MPILLQENAYCQRAYCSRAYAVGSDYAEALGRQWNVVFLGQPGKGYCGPQERYAENSYPWTPPYRRAQPHQFDYPKIMAQAHQYRLNVEGAVAVQPHQFSLSVANAPVVGHQILIPVAGTAPVWTQYCAEISTTQVQPHQFSLSVAQSPLVNQQFAVQISTNAAGTSPRVTQQYRLQPIIDAKSFHQIRLAAGGFARLGNQFLAEITQPKRYGHQVNYDSPYFYFSGGYCSGPYALQYYPWIAFAGRRDFRQFLVRVSTNVAGTSTRSRHQYELISTVSTRIMAHQIYLQLQRTRKVGTQFLSSLVPAFDSSFTLAQQFRIAASFGLKHQWRISVYNTTQLRILWEFASDGRTYNNVFASTEATGDFQAINLKSDIVEQVWRSTGRNSEWFQIDCGEGFVRLFDTIALINHNLTTGAVVRVKGYGAAYDAPPGNWASVPVCATMTVPDGGGEENLYWISPTVPAASFRYYRVEIQDPTNPDGYIQIGRFVGGAALIFQGENFNGRFQYAERNYKDEQSINGFTTISNNRALKKTLKIQLPSIDAIGKQNFAGLRRYTRYSRDTLKALVIPDPSMPYLYTVFAKLREVPSYDLNYVDGQTQYADISLEFDEGR
jgi:hypothetical protein